MRIKAKCGPRDIFHTAQEDQRLAEQGSTPSSSRLVRHLQIPEDALQTNHKDELYMSLTQECRVGYFHGCVLASTASLPIVASTTIARESATYEGLHSLAIGARGGFIALGNGALFSDEVVLVQFAISPCQ